MEERILQLINKKLEYEIAMQEHLLNIIEHGGLTSLDEEIANSTYDSHIYAQLILEEVIVSIKEDYHE